jgi:diketogulonate reductase-like aldo/keto reductase
MYGSSESVVGDLVKDLNFRNSLFLATKVWTTGRQEGIDQMNRSFTRMQTEKMDLMQVHNLLDIETHLKTLSEWKEQARIRYIGITHYTVSAYPLLIKWIKKSKPDFVQFNYNIQTREAENYLLPLAQDHQVAVIVNRPFEEGALLRRVKGKPLPPWANEYQINSWGEYFLKYILSHNAVTCIIPATSKVEHLQDNLKAALGQLPDESMRKKMVEYFNTL